MTAVLVIYLFDEHNTVCTVDGKMPTACCYIACICRLLLFTYGVEATGTLSKQIWPLTRKQKQPLKSVSRGSSAVKLSMLP